MSKETEKRLIKTLEFLKEPQGSTIPTIVRAIKDNDPKISLKRIVQTLKGCVESGVVRVADGRVKLKQLSLQSDGKSERVDRYDGLSDYRSQRLRKNPKVFIKCPKTCDDPDGGEGNPDGEPAPEPESPPPPPPPPPKPPRCRPKKPKCKPKPKCKKKKPKCKPKKKPKCKPKPKPKPKKKCPPKKNFCPHSSKKKKKCPD